MASNVQTIHVGDLKPMESMTVILEVKGLKMLRYRLWLGARIAKLGAWIIGCKITIEI
jgi:hypothetical protein